MSLTLQGLIIGALKFYAANEMAEKNKTKFDLPNQIDMALLPSLIGFNLRCAQVAVFNDFRHKIGKLQISPPQFGTLVLIEANPGISQSAIAATLRFDRSTLVQIIDRMEDRGFVIRKLAKNDRRSHALHLTQLGQTTIAKLKTIVWAHEEHISRSLSDNERQTLLNILARIYQTPEKS